MTDQLRLPAPIDPAAPPQRLAYVAAAVLIAGLLLAVAGTLAISQLSLAQALFGAWFVSIPIGCALLLAYAVIGRKRLRRFERRAGFLPRRKRMALPSSRRTALFRVEYGQRGGQVCLMLARWDHHARDGWKRSEVVHHSWHPEDDAVAIGADRARFTALAEQLEEESDDARLAYERQHGLAAERLAERAATRRRATWLAEQLARDSR